MSGLRQRKQGGVETTAEVPEFVQRLKTLDVYPKTLDDFKERTSSGATVSIVSCTIILFLVISELHAYLTPQTVDHLFVDTTRGQKLRINLNITFPAMPCAALSIVAMDVAGEQQIDVVHNLFKKKTDNNGRPRHGADSDGDAAPKPLPGSPPGCGKCYHDKPNPAGKCCNTCEDVKDVYKAEHEKWDDHSLCEHEVLLLDPSKMVAMKEGCNMAGFLEVNKVAGNFHFAPGKAFTSAHGQLVHEFKPFNTHLYNVSHTIHSLSFGAHYPNRVNPLDGVTRTLTSGSGVFQYFVKVVPTIYEYAKGVSTSTNQYSVTDHFKAAGDNKNGFVLPGAFFIYDLSPIMVKFTEKSTTFSYFLTSLCAIVGGVFTVAGILDGAIYHGSNHLKKNKGLA